MHPAPTFDSSAIGGLQAVVLRLVKLEQTDGTTARISRPDESFPAKLARSCKALRLRSPVSVAQQMSESPKISRYQPVAWRSRSEARNRHLLRSKQAKLGRVVESAKPQDLGVLHLFPWLADRCRRHPVPKSPHPNTSPTPSPPDHLRSLSPKPPFKTLHPAHIDPKNNSQQRNTLIPYTIHIHLSSPLLPSPLLYTQPTYLPTHHQPRKNPIHPFKKKKCTTSPSFPILPQPR